MKVKVDTQQGKWICFFCRDWEMGFEVFDRLVRNPQPGTRCISLLDDTGQVIATRQQLRQQVKDRIE